MTTAITVAWPAAPLGEAGWRSRLDDLATKAESLVGRDCGPQQAAELALELVGILWPVIGAPETIAATCRASLLVGPPGIVAASPAGDQLAEVHSRLDEIWHQAQNSPAASVVQLPVPVLNDLCTPGAPRRGRRPAPAPAGAEADADADELPEAWRDCPEPLPVVITPAPARPLRPLAERTAPRPAPAPAAEPHLEVIEPEPALVPLAQPTPAPRRRPAPAPAPPGWFTAGEAAELLEVEPCSVGRWRKEGRLGAEGTGWQQCGRSFYFSPEAVENIDRRRIPGGLDQLVAEVQAS